MNLINHFFSLEIYLDSDLTEIKNLKCVSFIPIGAGFLYRNLVVNLIGNVSLLNRQVNSVLCHATLNTESLPLVGSRDRSSKLQKQRTTDH